MQEYTATYSPEDNKLRLYASSRLDKELYDRVKAAGFKWAPKQELFVAPMWTPAREGFLIDLCGEIDDEDTSLVDRAEERAERFEDYSDKRKEDADRAHDAVSAIADNIPLGQPILVGHHSERHARKDAERIENGMRRAIKMWEQSEYWKDRAKGAIRAAKYKELPAVRARRIKTIEADKRKQERAIEKAQTCLKLWTREGLTLEQARIISGRTEAGYLSCVKHEDGASYWHAYDVLKPDEERYKACPSMTLEEVVAIAQKRYPATIAYCQRWIDHYSNRLAYECAMLEDQGGTVSDRVAAEKGGAIRCWASPRGGWSYIQKVNKVSLTVLDQWNAGQKCFTRTIKLTDVKAMITARDVETAREDGRLQEIDERGFYLLDQAPEPTRDLAWEEANKPKPEPQPEPERDFEGLRETLKAGVQVVSAPQLFPTPRELAERMIEKADIRPGHEVLEPSAGTGCLVGAMGGLMFGHLDERWGVERTGRVVAVEINGTLTEVLRREFPLTDVRCADFLECNGDLGKFDRIVMNPPFHNGADIKHIQHALNFLKPGGRLVALCANGPRQRHVFTKSPSVATWEELPAGSFSEQGTNVNVALLVINAPAEQETPGDGRLF